MKDSKRNNTLNMMGKYSISLVLFLVGASVFTGILFRALTGYPVKNQDINDRRVISQVLSDDVSATPYPTTGCTAPSAGCGSNYYWDQGTCMCTPAAGTCVPPYNGCPANYTFNSTTCECVASTSCTQPSTGCVTGYFWDSALCQCRPQPTSTYTQTVCPSPVGGCNTDKYWDSYSCQCVLYSSGSSDTTDYTSSACATPAAGCASGYYWDSGTCLCKQYQSTTATCYPPTTGCGTDKYWDSYTCACKTSATSCYPPSSDCPSNTYWNYGSCNCSEEETEDICSPSGSGCGTNAYWDYYYCACKLYADYQTYATTYYSTFSQVANFDRLAHESQERISCVKSQLSPYEFERLRYFLPTNSQEETELQNIGKKAEKCWLNTSESNYVKPLEAEKCLIKALGEPQYKEIHEGRRTPTYEENLKYEKCYGSVNRETILYQTAEKKIPTVIENCVKNVLGNDFYLKIKKGDGEIGPDLRPKVDKCFGADPQPFRQGATYKVPEEVKTCLLDKVGEKRFSEISGGGIPTDDEKNNGSECFAKLHKDQKNFLPIPVEQVPFLDEQNETVNLAAVEQRTQTKEDKILGGSVKFAGKAPPGSVVTIYIYSEPIVVTTKTDENGEWIYELNQPLSGQKHTAYASVKSDSGQAVRSSVYDFTVVAAEDELTNRFLEESSVNAPSRNRFINIAFILVAVAFILVILIYTFYYLKKVDRQFEADNSQKENPPDNQGTTQV